MLRKTIIAIAISSISIIFTFANQPQRLVVTTNSVFADMAENIAGGHLEIKTIVPIGSDWHQHKPLPEDLILLANADLILYNELIYGSWLQELISHSKSHAKTVTIAKSIDLITSIFNENTSNSHAWMSATNGLIYIENIKNAFVELDPENKEVYEINYGVYKRQLKDLDAYIQKKIQRIPLNQRILVTFHDAFQYYGREYGIRLEPIVETSTKVKAKNSDIDRLNNMIQKNEVQVVFAEYAINSKILEQIAKDNNIEISGPLYADSIGGIKSQAPSYYDMLKYNTDIIVAKLSQIRGNKHAKKKDNSYLIWSLLGVVILAILFLNKKKPTYR